MKKQEYEFLKSKFNAHMIAGYALALSGPELAVARGWRLLLAIADFQLAVKSVANTIPQYQQYVIDHPKLKAYNDAWDGFNAVYGVARITQGVAELGGIKWQRIKDAANDIKNDPSISATIKNDLKIDEIVGTVTSSTLINSLKAKLSTTGYDLLQTWKTNKTITYLDDISQTTLTGTLAENSLFASLDKKMADYSIVDIPVIESESQRLIIKTTATGPGKTKVFHVEKNINGNYNVNEYKVAYGKGGEIGYPPLSTNKTAPDFSLNTGNWLHPNNIGKQIKIKITGRFNSTATEIGDVELANIAANIQGKVTPEFYTWHHLDDFNLVTGECTMQLVKSDIHNLCKPHSGGVKQWEYYTGLTYKRN